MNIKEIQNPNFLKDLSNQELDLVAKDIRNFLIESVSKTGGHLSSNLGVVELTMAIHKVFNSPEDKILFDVGHQSYVHKILTGRAMQFDKLRQYNGLSGFQKRCESIHDAWEAGHSSTALSGAVGMAAARDINNDHYEIIPVIGDAAMVGGPSLEALNHLGSTNSKVIIILNDNQMSISKNVGGVDNFLSELRTSMAYNKAKQEYKEMLSHIPLGKAIYKFSDVIKQSIKTNLIKDTIFTEFGVDYLGPIDGHDFKDLTRALNKAKNSQGSIVVHVLTQKGKGYKYAERDFTGKWHGIQPFDIKTGVTKTITKEGYQSWSSIVSSQVLECMKDDEQIVAITPAMITGSKLECVFNKYPTRCFDVGIAEQHATTFAAGMAVSGKKPFLSMYSSFLQRAYDQINHDICRMNLPSLISVDRAGFVGEDGETHHGVFDIGFLYALPNAVIFTPSNAVEARQFINTSFKNNDCPYFIRISKQSTLDEPIKDETYLKIGTWTIPYQNNNAKTCIITYDDKVNKVIEMVKSNNYNVDVINARFIKPMDFNLLDDIAKKYETVIVYETDLKNASLCLFINQYYSDRNKSIRIESMGIDDHYTPQGTIDELLHLEELDIASLKQKLARYENG